MRVDHNFPSSLTIDLLEPLSHLFFFKSNGVWIEDSFKNFREEDGEEEMKNEPPLSNEQFQSDLDQLQVYLIKR